MGKGNPSKRKVDMLKNSEEKKQRRVNRNEEEDAEFRRSSVRPRSMVEARRPLPQQTARGQLGLVSAISENYVERKDVNTNSNSSRLSSNKAVEALMNLRNTSVYDIDKHLNFQKKVRRNLADEMDAIDAQFAQSDGKQLTEEVIAPDVSN